MENPSSHYKYSCRDCQIRQRCISEKQLGPSFKASIIHAFESHTDTYDMWDVLQQKCLLVQEAEGVGTLGRKESSLAERIRRAQQSPEETARMPAPQVKPKPAAAEEHPQPVERPVPPIKPPPAAPPPQVEPVSYRTEPVPWVPPRPEPPPTAVQPKPGSIVTAPFVTAETSQALPKKEALCDLFVVSTGRLVRLPHEGKIVLGRFEYGVEDPPDVDLAYDDIKTQSVSQRQACIIGKGGRHWIEDLGSANGTCLNNRRLPIGEKAQLSQGDQILLGECRVLYEPHPNRMLKPDPYAPHTSLLIITHTGKQIVLPPSSVLMIGRPDPVVGHMPDIDLSVAGKVASHVSRHHARMILRDGWHLIEDAGSSSGTRVNGSPIYRNDAPVRLHHGDQVWLGGCVLAYEWKV